MSLQMHLMSLSMLGDGAVRGSDAGFKLASVSSPDVPTLPCPDYANAKNGGAGAKHQQQSAGKRHSSCIVRIAVYQLERLLECWAATVRWHRADCIVVD